MTEPEKPSAEERIASLFAQIEQARADVAELSDPEAASKAIVPITPGSAPAEVTRAQLAHVRAAALKKTAHLESLQKALRSEMEARVREMDAIMEPLKKQVRQMTEGIWSVNLYLGRDEEIIPLLDGEPAPADTPITLRQQVLSMDEETAAMAASGGIDARNLDTFDEWIKNPVNLAQVFPEQKGVVVLVPRARGRDYKDPWVNERMRDENRWSYFLIRNGERLFRMRTDFVVGKHLIPTTDEFTGLFRRRKYNHTTRQDEVVDLIPGSREWDAASEAQDARQRHYMRMAMILQGLVDRTTVWHPLPPQGVNLLHNDTYEHGTAVLVRDAENAITDGREAFFDWLMRLNKELRPGMRVLGAFNTEEFREIGDYESPSRDNGWRGNPHDRITPRNSEWPTSATLYTLEGTRDFQGAKGLFFKFERTTKSWIKDQWTGRSELRAPKTKGACIVLPTDRFILPFDLVTVEEMRYYLGSRTHRKSYEFMFPLLHAAIEAKETEQSAEAPFRILLAGELAKAHNLTLDEAEQAVNDLVDWWKLANKWHRPLVVANDPATEGKAIKAILTEYAARQKAETGQSADAAAEAAMVAKIKAAHPEVMVIGRKRDGAYLAFAPQPRKYPADVVRHDAWAIEYTASKTGRGGIKTREWIMPSTRMDKTRVLFASEAWAKWDVHASPNGDLTDAEIDEVIATLPDLVVDYAAKGARGSGWNAGRKASEALLPLGVALDQSKQQFEVWVIRADEPEALATEASAEHDNTATASYGRVPVEYTKTARGGVTLDTTDNSGEPYFWINWREKTYSSATAAQPWHYFWNGSRQGAVTVADFADNQAISTARAAKIKTHNQAISERRDEVRDSILVLQRAVRARNEADAYDRFIEDYADPELWEGHKKTLRGLEPKIHPYGDVPAGLWLALCRFADQGRSVEGYTPRTLIEECGLSLDGLEDENLFDLPLWDDVRAASLDEDDEDFDEDEEFDAESEDFHNGI
jgi:hypothetical protein